MLNFITMWFSQIISNDDSIIAKVEVAEYSAIKTGLAGGIGFLTGTSATQLCAYLLRLPASTTRGTIFGIIGLGLSSASAVMAVDIAHSRDFRGERIFGMDEVERVVSLGATVLFGSFVFTLNRGKVQSLLPSDYCLPGTFSVRSAALRTGTEYADARNKGGIDMVGKLFGCHTCGDKVPKTYIGDHMPPNKFAKESNEKFYRFLPFKFFETVKLPYLADMFVVKQYFFPQCPSCSLIQSRAVMLKESQRPLKLHLLQLRQYHTSGVFIGWWWQSCWTPAVLT